MKKILSLLLVLSMLLTSIITLASCGDKGNIIGKIGDKVYYTSDSDYRDLINCFVIMNGLDLSDENIYKQSVTACSTLYLWSIVYEKELSTLGYKVNESEVKKLGDQLKEIYFTNYEGGFNKFCKDAGVSKNCMNVVAREYIIEGLLTEYLQSTDCISEEDMKLYYNNHIGNYIISVGNRYDVILYEILDLKDDAEVEKMLSEAKEGISKLNSGTSFNDLREEVKKKYSDDDHFFTGFASGEATITPDEWSVVTNIEEEIKAVEEDLAASGVEFDRNAEADSSKYKNYEFYVNTCYQLELLYALSTATKSGEIYQKPILSNIGYVVVKNLGARDKIEVTTLEEAKEEIKTKLFEEKYADIIGEYRNSIAEKYRISVINYN